MCRLLLLRRHVLKRFHPVKDLLLLLRRLTVELAQAVQQMLLLLRRKATKGGVLLQLLFLLIGGKAKYFRSQSPLWGPGPLAVELVPPSCDWAAQLAAVRHVRRLEVARAAVLACGAMLPRRRESRNRADVTSISRPEWIGKGARLSTYSV